tara:strand:+ start:606 stop:986 length:381 start_codon:yes stop_codon:yes gene_type:complete
METTKFIFNPDGTLRFAVDNIENMVIEDTDIVIESDIQLDYSKIYRLVDGSIVTEDYEMPQELITGAKWEEVRTERNRLLTESDWTQNQDVPETTRNAWTTYRQTLRDIPSTYSSPEEVVWPTKPS